LDGLLKISVSPRDARSHATQNIVATGCWWRTGGALVARGKDAARIDQLRVVPRIRLRAVAVPSANNHGTPPISLVRTLFRTRDRRTPSAAASDDRFPAIRRGREYRHHLIYRLRGRVKTATEQRA